MTVTKIDSNVTGLSFAEESSLKTLPGSPTWYGLEPNTYKDLGGTLKTVARSPINASRQRKKGVVTDLDAAGGFNSDLTMTNLLRLMQGVFFANWREQPTSVPMNAAQKVCTAIASTSKYQFAAPPAALVGALVLASGFANATNNGLKHVASLNSGDITVTETLVNEASPPAAATVRQVGFEGATSDITMTVSGSTVTLGSTVLDFTTLGLLPGQWIFIGGDATIAQFANGMNGLARIGVAGVAAHALTLDKVDFVVGTTDAGTGKKIQIFVPNLLRNEPLPADIITRTYQVERTLGSDANGVMSQYLTGAVANQLTLNVAQATKATVDIDFIACDDEQRPGTTGVKAGSRPTLVSENALNTSSDIKRMNLALVSTNAAQPALFGFATDATLTLSNNAQGLKAIGVLGSFNVSSGEFDVDGKLTVYFADIAAVQAVRNNADVTFDMFAYKDNQGHVWDAPLIGLGNGLLKVEQNKPVTLPLDAGAAQSPFGYTLSLCYFPYLPTLASA